MINQVKGNIFNSQLNLICVTVNCVGAMGAGLAWVIREHHHDVYIRYKRLCKEKKLTPGKLVMMTSEISRQRFLLFPTKDHWVHPSEYEYLAKGLQLLKETYQEKGITELALPLLGCRNGGLNKVTVIDMIYQYLGDTNINIELYI